MRRFREQKDLRSLSIGIIVGVLVVALLLLIIPIDIVYKVPVQAKVYPSKEWKILGSAGEFQTTMTSFDGSRPVPERVFVFDRGDVVDMVYASGINDGTKVKKDSTILTFTSQMLNLRIQQVLNQRDINLSQIKASNAAMKKPLYDSASEQVELARADMELQSLNLERMEQLYADGVISKFELDNQVTAFRVANQELKVAERNLENTTFELKPEDVEVFAMTAETAENELDVLLKQLEAYKLRAPFNGAVRLHPEPGTVLSIQDESRRSLVFPVPIDEYALIDEHSKLILRDDSEQTFDFSIKSKAGVLGGSQYVMGFAEASEQESIMGEVMSAYIVCDTISFREYLLRKLN
jgi:hypothetical protein